MLTKLFDLWMNDAWIGMSEGETSVQARELVTATWPKFTADQIVMTPFEGPGTSLVTYKMCTGREAKYQ